MKRWVSSLLVLAQISAGSAMAATRTPEFKLLETSIAVTGQKLTPAQMDSKLAGAALAYDLDALLRGRVRRMTDAMVELRLATPVQAREFAQRLRASSDRLKAMNLHGDALVSATTRELSGILARSQGAQFSSSAGSCLGAIGITLGGTAFLTWGYFDTRDTNQGMSILAAVMAGAFAYGTGQAIYDCATGRLN